MVETFDAVLADEDSDRKVSCASWLKVIRVEREDDGSLTAVTDYYSYG